MDFTININTLIVVASMLVSVGAFAQKFRSHETLDAERFKNISERLSEIKDDIGKINQ